jgi:hypothetical protein
LPPQQQQQQHGHQHGFEDGIDGREAAMSRLTAVPLQKWTNNHVLRWLSTLHLGQYSDAFERTRTDGVMLVSVSDVQLQQRFGITNKYHRRKIHLNASLLKQQTVTTPDSRTAFDAEVAAKLRDGVGYSL